MKRLIFIVPILFACSGSVERLPEPDHLIPRKKIVDILAELTKLEALVQNEYTQVNRYYRVMTQSGDSLLNTFGVKRTAFEESLDYYGSRQNEMASIYDDVLEQLNKELADVQSSQ